MALVLLALAAIVAARVPEDCQLRDETSLMQIAIATKRRDLGNLGAAAVTQSKVGKSGMLLDGGDGAGKTEGSANPCSSCGCSFLGRDGAPTDCDIEVNSRAMVHKWIPEDASTLEVGARYGSVSCAIAEKQKQSGKQVSVDADHRVWESLEKNRVKHSCNFHTVRGLLAKHDGRIFENGFGTVAAGPESFAKLGASDSGVVVPHFTVAQIEKQYGLKFDTGNFDCEGCAALLLRDFPELKTQLNLIVLEQHDDAEANATADLLRNGWVMVDRLSRQRVLANRHTQPRSPSNSTELLSDWSNISNAASNIRAAATAGSVQWIFESGDCPTDTMGLSCVDICASRQLSCSHAALQALSTEAAVKEAYAASGNSCKVMSPVQVASFWEGPVASAGTCLFNTHPDGFTLCEGSAGCGYRRICPCN